MKAPARRSAVAGLVVALTALGVSAQSVPKITFTDTKLKNGLRVIISEDHNAPAFSIVVNYNVGSANERKGRTGFAHLFEHMMFKGSENVGPGEHPYLMFMYGGNMNGTTNKDRTLYYEVMPANQLDLALFLEADRMRSLDITAANLENQRNAVQEERRLGVDNQPYGKTSLALDELAYDNFAYEHSVIGSMEDLSAATVDDVAAFFKTYYAPNNAVIAIVGDVDTKTTLEKVRKYFEPIPSQPQPAKVDLTEPPQTAERRTTMEDALARLPRLDMVYKIPPAGSPDADALSVLASILSGGRSARLYESIVRQKQLSGGVSGFASLSRGPGLFQFGGTPLPGKTPAELEAAIEEEITKIQSTPVADWELQKARNSARANFIGGLGSTLNRAIQLSEDALAFNDPGRINTRAASIAKVTAADVQRVAKQYLVKTNRTVIVTTPKAAAPKGVE
ncbi:MAG TPA: pitrilysin family protein [Vicinamibacterales bacterium]|nr:pitrilysin family protein [Vicinamibacterales bacterium]